MHVAAEHPLDVQHHKRRMSDGRPTIRHRNDPCDDQIEIGFRDVLANPVALARVYRIQARVDGMHCSRRKGGRHEGEPAGETSRRRDGAEHRKAPHDSIIEDLRL